MKETQHFPRTLRLVAKHQFQAVFRVRKRLFTPYFTLYYRFTDQPHPRLGVIIAKRNIKHAVGRNRVRRQARETFRQKQHELSGLDILFVVQKSAHKASNAELRECIEELLEQLGGLRDKRACC